MAVEFLRASAVHLNPAAVTIQKSNDRDTETESGMASRFPMDTPAREMRVRRRRATSSGDSLQIERLKGFEDHPISCARQHLNLSP